MKGKIMVNVSSDTGLQGVVIRFQISLPNSSKKKKINGTSSQEYRTYFDLFYAQSSDLRFDFLSGYDHQGKMSQEDVQWKFFGQEYLSL